MTKSKKKGWRAFGQGAVSTVFVAILAYVQSPEAVGFLADQVTGVVGAAAVPVLVGVLEYGRNLLKHGEW